MATSEPGEPSGPGPGRVGRRLERPPSSRYAARTRTATDGPASLAGPLARAGLAAVLGAAVLFVVGAIFASTVGLVFVSGAMGATIGLALARAAVSADERPPALRRSAARWLAIGFAVAAVLVAAVGTWLFARQEGGTLGLLDYLLATFGPFVPGELVVAALGAAWGATSGPVQRS